MYTHTNMTSHYVLCELQNSFIALLLAFQTDRLTLSSRLELQTRLRDQAELNMTNEIQHLQNIVMVWKNLF